MVRSPPPSGALASLSVLTLAAAVPVTLPVLHVGGNAPVFAAVHAFAPPALVTQLSGHRARQAEDPCAAKRQGTERPGQTPTIGGLGNMLRQNIERRAVHRVVLSSVALPVAQGGNAINNYVDATSNL